MQIEVEALLVQLLVPHRSYMVSAVWYLLYVVCHLVSVWWLLSAA